eukprot:8559134-Alexandrium_andersonii.AAC.1
MVPNQSERDLAGWTLKLCPAPNGGLQVTDCAQILDCRRNRFSNGLPDQGAFSEAGRLVPPV